MDKFGRLWAVRDYRGEAVFVPGVICHVACVSVGVRVCVCIKATHSGQVSSELVEAEVLVIYASSDTWFKQATKLWAQNRL